MGIVYEGPYRHLIDSYAHEGYAACLLPDGTLTGAWTPRIAETFTGYVPACECGWRATDADEAAAGAADARIAISGPDFVGVVVFPPTEDGEAAAEAEWEAEHLRPMIAAARASWPDWARGVAARAEQVAEHMAAGRPARDVEELFARLADDVAGWRRVVTELADVERIERGSGGER